MIKRIFFLVALILNFSCTDLNQSENTLDKIENLERENDSLKMILLEIDEKYVFDSISYRNIFGAENTFKLNSKVESEIIIVAYSPNQNYFVQYDSKMSHPDTLSQSFGGYKFSTNLDKIKKPINVNIQIDNKFGRKDSAKIRDTIEIINL